MDSAFMDDLADPGCIVSDGFRVDALREATAGIVAFIKVEDEDKQNYDSSGSNVKPVIPAGGADG